MKFIFLLFLPIVLTENLKCYHCSDQDPFLEPDGRNCDNPKVEICSDNRMSSCVKEQNNKHKEFVRKVGFYLFLLVVENFEIQIFTHVIIYSIQ